MCKGMTFATKLRPRSHHHQWRYTWIIRCSCMYLTLYTICALPLVGSLCSFLPLASRPDTTWRTCLRSRRPSTRFRLSSRKSTPVCSLDNLREVQRQSGRVVAEVSYEDGLTCKEVLVSGFEAGTGIGQRAREVDQAVASSTLVVDQSHWGIIRVEGEDRLRFLHSQGTNAFEGVDKGRVVPTCFTSNTGRVVDFCEAVVLEDEVWLLSSPHRWRGLLENMDKFIFPMDRITVSSLSKEKAIFTLTGPQAGATLELTKYSDLPRPGRFVEHEFRGEKVIVINHSRPITTGGREAVAHGRDDTEEPSGTEERTDNPSHLYQYTLLVPAAAAAELWTTLLACPSVVTAGEAEWQTLRIKRGLPFAGKELTNDYNPLEAGLWHSVHFDKGCYIGQESISRVNAYKALKSALYGVTFEKPGVPEGTALIVEDTGKMAGSVTSMMDPEILPPAGLAYIKTQAGGVGLKVVTKDGVSGTVVEVPYPTRSDAESAMPPAKKDPEEQNPAAVSLDLKEEKAKDAARKAAKLEAMQKKLDALKSRKKAS